MNAEIFDRLIDHMQRYARNREVLAELQIARHSFGEWAEGA